MQQADDLKVLAKFTVELLAAVERRAATFSEPQWLADDVKDTGDLSGKPRDVSRRR
jgi:hypothetical protein